METKVRSEESMAPKGVGKSLPIFKESCSFVDNLHHFHFQHPVHPVQIAI